MTMPKYTVYGQEVIHYRAEVSAKNLDALYEKLSAMNDEEIGYVEYDGSPVEVTSVELDGEKVA
jgi:hypothetical protein